ncbi:hypothetical protein HPP92_012934 [Vanilla planifolia]|uniref:Uncharacterized protein n=1 Tax=Vanilla planifolia TaxID=51239 RepID=A0A835QY29_VANPL|nr:hypothetical protein HPP92_012934 [Vanilla planifolia]
MRALVGFWILFAAAFLAPKTCSGVSDSSIPIDKTVRLLSNGAPKPESTNRKSATFFGSAFEFQTTTGEDNLNSYTMDDYLMPDPTPSSKVDVHSGPIEHGTPTNPFIPSPTPPAHPGQDSP